MKGSSLRCHTKIQKSQQISHAENVLDKMVLLSTKKQLNVMIFCELFFLLRGNM